jgi:hypothetical protein
VQVYGGHGYIREHGVEQLVRDSRITQIYEGTNGIQALDLAGRKLGMDNGRLLRPVLGAVSDLCEKTSASGNGTLERFSGSLRSALAGLQLATLSIGEKGAKDPEEVGAAATDYLRLLGLVAVGYTFLKAADIAVTRLAEGTGEAAFYEAKITTAAFYFDRILPQANSALEMIRAGKASMMALPAEAF